MSNVVQFLEALSLDTNALTQEQYAEAVSSANLDIGARDALLKRDSVALNRHLGGRATVLAFVFPAEEEPDGDRKEDDTQPDDGEKEAPQHGQDKAQAA